MGMIHPWMKQRFDIPRALATMNLLPYDPHPSTKANKIYAERLSNAINLLR